MSAPWTVTQCPKTGAWIVSNGEEAPYVFPGDAWGKASAEVMASHKNKRIAAPASDGGDA